MKIERVQLTSFRGFEHLELTPEADLTVLVGVNGAGKSSVLEGIRIALEQIPRRYQGRNKAESALTVSDIRMGATEAAVDLDARTSSGTFGFTLHRSRSGEARNEGRRTAVVLDEPRAGLLAGRPQLPLALFFASDRHVPEGSVRSATGGSIPSTRIRAASRC
ncbi:MAG: AAA family ATPase [Sandaracinaceae bacterium]|nr:AAA family ATPase [Sandaracinaceae bacterium]